jgi:hypothetical protein
MPDLEWKKIPRWEPTEEELLNFMKSLSTMKVRRFRIISKKSILKASARQAKTDRNIFKKLLEGTEKP